MTDFINATLGVPLGLILRFFYNVTEHFGMAVLFFAVAVRFIMFPINFLAHRNSIRFLRLQPALYRLKKQFSVDKESLNAAQLDLFKEKGYKPMMGLIPLFLQLFLLIGVLQVMYHPLQHVLNYDADTIAQLLNQYNASGTGAQLVAAASRIDMNFLGINLGDTPSFASPALLGVVALSGITSWVFCIFQAKFSPGALTQSARANLGLTVFTVVFSVYFTFVIPAGVGVYWIIGNLLGVVVTLVLDLVYNPKKAAPQAYEHIMATKKSKEELKKEAVLKKALKVREKEDVARFNKAKKELVFYSLSGGQYKYYSATIEYILNNSDITIHYLTNDATDKVFEFKNPQFKAYYASERKTIMLLLRLECDVMATTVQDLQVFHMKRSVADLDIEYIHIPHGLGSVHLTARESAYDHYDTFFCAGEHHVNELRRREEMSGMPKKRYVKAGYGLLDDLRKMYQEMQVKNEKPQILIAPSWQPDNIMDLCIDPLLDGLLGQGWHVIVRPHPQHSQVFPESIEQLAQKYSAQIGAGELVLDTDLLGSTSIFMSDILITDWSGIAHEFSFATLKPSIFINTPMKVLNPTYKEYGIEATDITLRDKIGVSVDVDELDKIGNIVHDMLTKKDDYAERVHAISKEMVYHHGRSGEAGGKYIIGQLNK